MDTTDTLLERTEEKMMQAAEAAEGDFSRFRSGKASPGLIENIMVDYYGTSTRLRDIAGITTPEPRLLVVQPWDQNALAAIEKAIQVANLGISPVNDGRIIRLPVPELSEERRKDLIKQVKKRAEEAKVELRNHRRDANEIAKKAQKASDITEDDLKELFDNIQKLTDSYITQIDELTAKKEKELLTV